MACNTYMYILYYLLYAGIGFWSLNKLSKMGETFYSSESSIKIIMIVIIIIIIIIIIKELKLK